jgi:hypothetical protein
MFKEDLSMKDRLSVMPGGLKGKQENGYESIPGRNMGLCMNCENRTTCRFSIVDGGIWFCEEYL